MIGTVLCYVLLPAVRLLRALRGNPAPGGRRRRGREVAGGARGARPSLRRAPDAAALPPTGRRSGAGPGRAVGASAASAPQGEALPGPYPALPPGCGEGAPRCPESLSGVARPFLLARRSSPRVRLRAVGFGGRYFGGRSRPSLRNCGFCSWRLRACWLGAALRVSGRPSETASCEAW